MKHITAALIIALALIAVACSKPEQQTVLLSVTGKGSIPIGWQVDGVWNKTTIRDTWYLEVEMGTGDTVCLAAYANSYPVFLTINEETIEIPAGEYGLLEFKLY